MTADKEKYGAEKFASRWSRLKEQAREKPTADPPAPQVVDPAAPPPELPPLDQLTADSDFRGFLHPKVDDNLRRAALKKLFSDPHFNVMDGLDVYVDDYSQSNPIPASMLAQLKQAQKILQWARESKEDAEKQDAEKQASLLAAAVPPALADGQTAAGSVPVVEQQADALIAVEQKS